MSAGCLAVEMAYFHSTSFVTPVASMSAPLPAAGPVIAVKVEDRRGGAAGYEVGSKYYRSYEASTIDLAQKASLADHVAQDAVAMLRREGYRAQLIGDLPPDSADVLVTIRIDVFNMLFLPGQDVQLDGLLLMAAVRARDSRGWVDAVGARFESASSFYPSDAEYQGCFEWLYATLRIKMRDRIRAGFPF
jgi:hypothetical protein